MRFFCSGYIGTFLFREGAAVRGLSFIVCLKRPLRRLNCFQEIKNPMIILLIVLLLSGVSGAYSVHVIIVLLFNPVIAGPPRWRGLRGKALLTGVRVVLTS